MSGLFQFYTSKKIIKGSFSSNCRMTSRLFCFVTRKTVNVENHRVYSTWHESIVKQGESKFLKSFDLPEDGEKRIRQMIHSVVSTNANTGDVVPNVVMKNLCNTYHNSNASGKKLFLLTLAKGLSADPDEVKQRIRYYLESMEWVSSFLENESTQSSKSDNNNNNNNSSINWGHADIERYYRSHRNLRLALKPLHEDFFEQIIAKMSDGMPFLVKMREDLLHLLSISKTPRNHVAALKALDSNLKQALGNWFRVGFLKLDRLTFEESSGALLDKIVRYEAVHPVKSLNELKRRLGNSRRCFAFFHPNIPKEPLVFVHVALLKNIANSMIYIEENTGDGIDETLANTAIFYSISSTQKGLAGIDLGNFLIKQVADRLKQENPSIVQFATLSPIPGFIKWLNTKLLQDYTTVLSERTNAKLREIALEMQLVIPEDASQGGKRLISILNTAWHENPKVLDEMKFILMPLAARYLYTEKRRNMALCPVANFHIRNGAIMHRLNWMADLSKKGLVQSAGIMVNYRYLLDQVEKNNEMYILKGKISTTPNLLEWVERNTKD